MKRIPVLTTLTALAALWTIAVFGLVPSAAEAAVPRLINFQGVLKDAAGNPPAVDMLDVSFTIYDAPLGGTALWTETHSVTITDGLFSVLLGDFNPLPDSVFEDTVRYLGIKVATDPEMLPRQRLASVGFAYRVGTIDGATGGVISGDVSIQSNLSVDGGMGAKTIFLEGDPDQPLVGLQASPLQTANLVEIKDDLGAILGSVDSKGKLFHRYGIFAHSVSCGETLSVDQLVATPAIQLKSFSPTDNTISNFPNPVPIRIETSKGSMYIGRNDGVLQQISMDPAASVSKLTEWKNGAGATVASIEPSGAMTIEHELGHNLGFCHGGAADFKFLECTNSVGNPVASIDASGKLSTPAIQLNGPSTISNFPSPVPLTIETDKGGIFIGGSDGILFKVSAATGASVSKLQEWKNGAGAAVCSIDPAGNMSIDGDMDGLNSTWETGSFIDLNCSGTFNASGGAEIGGQDFIVSTGGSQFLNPVGIQTPPLPTFALDAAGSIHATSFPVSSDFRLKENVRPLTNVLDKLEKVRGVSFDWNETYEELGRSSGHREIGVIAQEVESVFPELVTKWGEKDYRAVDYGRMTAVLIEAVKEQQKQIEKLAKEIEKLKNQSHQAQVEN